MSRTRTHSTASSGPCVPLHVGGYELPPDILIAPSMYLAHRREDV